MVNHTDLRLQLGTRTLTLLARKLRYRVIASDGDCALKSDRRTAWFDDFGRDGLREPKGIRRRPSEPTDNLRKPDYVGQASRRYQKAAANYYISRQLEGAVILTLLARKIALHGYGKRWRLRSQASHTNRFVLSFWSGTQKDPKGQSPLPKDSRKSRHYLLLTVHLAIDLDLST